MQNAITYSRKSIIPKHEDISAAIGYQEHSMQEYADQNNMIIRARFNDIGYSGKTLERPELIEMLEYIEHNPVDVLLVFTVDRFGRDLKNNINLVLKILSKVPKIIFTTDCLSSDSKSFKYRFLMDSGYAHEERERLHKRFNGGRRAKILNRRTFNGNQPPIGFTKHPTSKKLVPATILNTSDVKLNQGLAIVQFIFLSYIFGKSLREIAKLVNYFFGSTQKNKNWDSKAISYVLRNPVYTGKLRGTLEKNESYFIDGNVEPIIDPALFYFVQYRLGKETSGRKSSKSQPSPHLFVCANCITQISILDDQLVCEFCHQNTELMDVTDAINAAFKKFLINDLDLDTLTKELITKIKYELSLKKRDLQKRIFDLMERRKEFESMNFIDEKILNNMISINTEELFHFQIEYEETKSLSSFIENVPSSDFDQRTDHSYFLSLPFIVFIDIPSHEIALTFHRNIFYKEDVPS